MTDRETDDRLRDLLRQAERLRVPNHRRGVDTCMEAHDELREGLRKLLKERTGIEPGRHPTRVVPTASMFPPRGRGQGNVIVEHRRRA